MVVQVFQKMAFSIIVFFSKSIVFYHDQVENAVQIISDVLPYDGNEAPKLLEQEVSEGVLRRPEIEKFIINCAQLVQTKIARDAGTESAPNFWQICLSTKKGQIMPTNNYWHLQIFSPSRILVMGDATRKINFSNVKTDYLLNDIFLAALLSH